MRILFLLTLALTLSTPVFASPATTAVAAHTARPRKKMKAFRSDRELERYLRTVAYKAARARRASIQAAVTVSSEPAVETTRSELVTNTQHAGVDEGGIVKLHGDHLVMLRRGRLFTVAIGNGALEPVSSIDAFGPEIDPHESWYDEMLISGDTIVVIGYSYARTGTEVGLFNIDSAGQLSYRATYHVRSSDYYSSRNYASRLIGTKLIFYTPVSFNIDSGDPFQSFPAVRRWHKGATDAEYRRITTARRVYRPQVEFKVDDGLTMHSVTVCDLARGGFTCEATTVLGPSGNVFYVSPDSVYVWATSWNDEREAPEQSLLFRLPLDGSTPSALQVSGGPTDQFSFLQSEDQHLNVLVRAQAKGDGMWNSAVAEGDVALMRISLSSFSDGSEAVPLSSYRQLPQPRGYDFQNRFVHGYLLYGAGNGGWNDDYIASDTNVYIVDWKQRTWQTLELSHGVNRIEQMGPDAVVIGNKGKDLQFSAVRLGQPSSVVSRYTRRDASEGDSRSQGFFYKPDGDDSGTLGLPLSLPAAPKYQDLFETSSAVLFLRNEARQFREVGELSAQTDKAIDDKCRASCVDWYGNSRPLFLRGRVFALMGYELVEGKVENGRMQELRRINFAPGN